jgi:pimeloyl-ACP methyl ester carboxylesterase
MDRQRASQAPAAGRTGERDEHAAAAICDDQRRSDGLLRGWPELAFSWRHQIRALADAGIRVIAPDQRGMVRRPEPVEAYELEHLTADLVGLLDHLKIDKAIFVGHDWGGDGPAEASAR